MALGEDFELNEDSFYQKDHKLEDYGDVEQVFKSTLEKQGVDPGQINLDFGESVYNTIIKDVLDKFNSTGIIPEISGFLQKKSGFMKFFQKRYFVCRGKELCYFLSPTDCVLRGCINFDI